MDSSTHQIVPYGDRLQPGDEYWSVRNSCWMASNDAAKHHTHNGFFIYRRKIEKEPR